MLKIFTITIFLKIIFMVSGKVRIIPDERYQYCNESVFLREGDIARGNIFDSDLSFVMVDENTVVINGSFWNVIPIEQETLSMLVKAEKLEMDDWHKRHQQLVSNFCKEAFNPLGIYYPYYGHLPRCPYKIGTEFNWKDKELDLSYLVILPQYYGRWKLIVDIQYESKSGEIFKDCFILKADVEYY